MKKTSVLLALDGSEEAYFATEAALQLAEKSGANLDALHVIDTKTAWALLGTHKAGLIGSGLYIDAYERLCDSLRELADALAQRYEAMATAQSLNSKCIIDEGNPFEVVSKRAADHSLLVIGHQPTASKYPHFANRPFTRTSLAGALANACTTPVLIVQERYKPTTTVTMLGALNDLSADVVAAGREMVSQLGLTLNLALLNPSRDCSSQFLERRIAELGDSAADLRVEVIDLDGAKALDLWTKKPIEIDLEAFSQTLLMVPTKVVDDNRITIFGSTPGSFLRHLPLGQVILFPQERAMNLKDELVTSSASSSQ